METGILHLHGGLRYIVLALLIWAIVSNILRKNQAFGAADRKLAMFAMVSTHIQLLLGLLLWFLLGHVNNLAMMSNPVLRFKALEHPVAMILGIVLITIGYSTAKRMSDDAAIRKRIAIMYGLGLLVILSRIPWPFLVEGGKWF